MNKKANQDIRDAMKAAGVSQWQVAHFFSGGVHENTLRSKLRFELGLDEKGAVFAAIEQAKVEFHKGG